MPPLFTGTESVQGPLGMPTLGIMPHPSDEPPDPTSDMGMAQRAEVKRWVRVIKQDKAHWKNDFDRMRRNMEFVAGLQYTGQSKIEEERYIANWTLQRINQKVATLYARDPKVVVKRRKRMDYQLWDEKMESIQQAVSSSVQLVAARQEPAPEAMAIMNDFQRGRQMQELVEKVGRTLEILFQFQMDTQEPNFKVQAKQWVRRVCVCGVGYLKVLFCRDYSDITHSETRQAAGERAKMAQEILQRLVDGKIDETSADMGRLQNLVSSLHMEQTDSEKTDMQEKLVFDFPAATAIIPDRNCRILKGFVGAKYVTEEFIYPIEYVNAMYGTQIKPGGEVKVLSPDGKEDANEMPSVNADQQLPSQGQVAIWQVHNLQDKTTFIVCEGYKDYVMAPEVVTPATSGFWTIFPLTFNDVESEPNCKNTIFPPSDVDLMRSAQREWNRTREALRAQRKANAPKYMCPKGTLSENDKTAIQMAQDNQVIELENLAPGQDPSKVVVPLQTADIDMKVYDTGPLEQDAMLVSALQEANIGAAQPNVTATVGSIAEHSRQTINSSNVDDLDDCLSAATKCGGELLLMEMSPETVQKIVGLGAVFPAQDRAAFLNEVELEVEAASSGRPNKAIELDNFQKMAPFLIQFGANPQAVIREGIKRLDDRLDPADFFPAGPVGGPPPTPEGSPQGNPPGAPSQEPQAPPTVSNGKQQMYPAQQPI